MRVPSEAPAERYRRLARELEEAKQKNTQASGERWGPNSTTHAALGSHAVLTRHLQRMARLETAIRKLEGELFPNGDVPSNQELFPALGSGSTSEALDPAIRTRSSTSPAVGVAALLDAAAGRVAIPDNGHVPLRTEPIAISLGGTTGRIEQVGAKLRVVTADASFDVVERTPSAWILRADRGGSHRILDWDVPLSTGELKPLAPPGALHPLAHRGDEPAFVSIGADGATLVFENGLAFDQNGRVGVVDLANRDRSSWLFEARAEQPYRPPYDNGQKTTEPFVSGVDEPWKARVEPVAIGDQRAFRIVTSSSPHAIPPILFQGRIYADAMFVDGAEVRSSRDHHLIRIEPGPPARIRVPTNGEKIDDSWVEAGRTLFAKQIPVRGHERPATLVRAGFGHGGGDPVRLEVDGAPVKDGVFDLGDWIVQAKKGEQVFWRVERTSAVGQLGSIGKGTDRKLMFFGKDGPREGLLPKELFGSISNIPYVLAGGRLHEVNLDAGDQLVTQPVRPMGERFELDGTPALLRKEKGAWVEQSSGIADLKPGDPLTTFVWFDGKPFRADGSSTEGPFRIIPLDGSPERHVVSRTGATIEEVHGPVPGLLELHHGVLHDVALPREDLAEATARLRRLLSRDAFHDHKLNRLAWTALTRARKSIAAEAATIEDLVAALRRGDDALVGGPEGLTGRELRRAIGFIDDNPFTVLARPPPATGLAHRVTEGNDAMRYFPGAPELLAILDADRKDATPEALTAFFDGRVPKLDALTQKSAGTVRAKLVPGLAPTIAIEADGKTRRLAVETHGAALSPSSGRFFADRLSQLSPKLVGGVAELEHARFTFIASMDVRGKMQFNLGSVDQHRASVVDHELIHGQALGDRELQLLAAIAVKLGPPPDDSYADTTVEEILTVHWQRMVENPGGVLGKNPHLDRLALAVAVDPDFGPSKTREAIESRGRPQFAAAAGGSDPALA